MRGSGAHPHAVDTGAGQVARGGGPRCGLLAGFCKINAEFIALANNIELGLASYFGSRDMARVRRVACELEVGLVGINSGVISTAAAPFGGVKQPSMERGGSRHGNDRCVPTTGRRMRGP